MMTMTFIGVALVSFLLGMLVSRALLHLDSRSIAAQVERNADNIDAYTGSQADLSPQEARVIDPDNPPHYRTYRGPSNEDLRLRCTCHNRPLPNGATVLFWPIPDHPDGGIDLLCEETFAL